MLRLLVTLLPLILILPARAQVERAHPRPDEDIYIRFEHLGVEDGVSQATARVLLQDRHGFIWIGSYAGLNRYDGYSITVYAPIPFDSTSLSEGQVNALLEARDGAIWVGTRDGLNRFDPETETFRRFLHRPGDSTSLSFDGIQAIAEGADGSIWVGTPVGLERLDPAYRRFKLAALPKNVPPQINDIYYDRRGRLWVAGDAGLMRVESAGDSARLEVVLPPVIGTGRFLRILERSVEPGVLWLTGHGLTRFDTRTGEVRTYVNDPSATFMSTDGITPNLTLPIAEDPLNPNILWTATHELERFDVLRGEYQTFVLEPVRHDRLISDLMVDATGIIWVGSRGIQRFDPAGTVFVHYYGGEAHMQPRGMAEDREGGLWVAVEARLLRRFDPSLTSSTLWSELTRNPEVLAGEVWDVHIDGEGFVWIGSLGPGGGLFRLDPSTGLTRRISGQEPGKAVVTSIPGQVAFERGTEGGDQESAQTVRRIFEDRQGALWIGSSTGAFRFDRRTETFQRVLSGAIVSTFFEDRFDRLWIGTWTDGFAELDRDTGELTWYRSSTIDSNRLSHGRVNVIYESGRMPGILWIATYGGGLDRLDTETGVFQHLTAEHGLPDNVVYGILEDDDGLLWLSTNRGVASLNPENREIRAFGLERGLQSLEYNTNSYYRSRATGALHFGGPHGLNRFYPGDLRPDPTPPAVVISGLRLFNQRVTSGRGGPLARPIHLADEVRLGPDQDVVTFEFTALHFRYPSRNTYSYVLEGFDSDWIQADTRREATYTNLDPGRYTFRVRAANADGVWNEAGASVALVVLPPWWRSGWAYALYVLLFVAGVFAIDRIQRRRLIRRERERAHQELKTAYEKLEQAHDHLKTTQAQLVQQEKLASLGQVTAGIAHEIRNPLNFINNFAELSAELVKEAKEAQSHGEDISPLLADLEKNAQVVVTHGRRAEGIVRSMMEHFRGSRGRREATNVNGLVQEYIDVAFNSKRMQVPDLVVEIERRLDPATGDAEMVPQDIGRVLLNLLGNAFDAVHELHLRSNGDYQPTVRVETLRRNNSVEVRVCDNGPGVSEEIRTRIFEPFFTTKAAGSGTGLGLSISHEIVTSGHGGTLTVESRAGEGSTFVVTLPAAP